jgi:hypothetical protein
MGRVGGNPIHGVLNFYFELERVDEKGFRLRKRTLGIEKGDLLASPPTKKINNRQGAKQHASFQNLEK